MATAAPSGLRIWKVVWQTPTGTYCPLLFSPMKCLRRGRLTSRPWLACAVFRLQDPKSEVAALRAQIKAAERDGNLEEAIRLAEELDRKARARS